MHVGVAQASIRMEQEPSRVSTATQVRDGCCWRVIWCSLTQSSLCAHSGRGWTIRIYIGSEKYLGLVRLPCVIIWPARLSYARRACRMTARGNRREGRASLDQPSLFLYSGGACSGRIDIDSGHTRPLIRLRPAWLSTRLLHAGIS
jgi:hypothetical protein